MTDDDTESGSAYDAGATSRAEWTALPRNPDLRTDLGYELVALERIEAPGKGDDVVFLPMDESLLREDAFLVAGPGGRCDLAGKR